MAPEGTQIQQRVARLRAGLARFGATGTWHPGPIDRLIARARRPLDRRLMLHASAAEAHRALGASVEEAVGATGTGRDGRRVLVCALRGMPDHNAYEMVIAQALRLRGAEVAVLTCGSGLPMCEIGWARNAEPRPCDRCGWVTDRLATASGMRQHRLSDHLPWGARASRAPLVPMAPTDGLDPEEAARISAVWSLRTTDLEQHPDGPEVARDYAVAVSGAGRAAAEVLSQFSPDIVFMLNGTFAAERAIRAAALERGLRVPTYEIAPRGRALVFSQAGFAPYLEMDAIWERARDRQLTPDQEAALDAHLGARFAGRVAHETYEFDAGGSAAIRRQARIPDGKRIVSLFTNITWDSALQGNDTVYASMMDFVVDAVSRAAELHDGVLVVRSHPAEVKWGTNEPIETSVRARVTRIPDNVRFVGPADTLNSYELMAASDLVLAYATTAGLEAAVQGIPVVVAADAHYRGRGFTIDLSDAEDLSRVFRELPVLGPAEVELARRYAFAFFFRAMVPVAAVARDVSGAVGAMPSEAQDLVPGSDPFLDFICDRILDGGEFEVPDELIDGPGLLAQSTD